MTLRTFIGSAGGAIAIGVVLGLVLGPLMVKHRREVQRQDAAAGATGAPVVLERNGFGSPQTVMRVVKVGGCDYVAITGTGGYEAASMTHHAACTNPAHHQKTLSP